MMSRLFAFLLLCALSLTQSLAYAKAIPPVRPSEELIWQGVADVTNVMSLDLRKVPKDTKRSWVLASVNHAPKSGAVVVRSFGIDGETGKLIKLKGQDFVNLKGTVHILSTLTGVTLQKDYSFDWKFPFSMSDIFPTNTYEPPKETPQSRLSGFRGVVLFPLPEDWKSPDVLPIYPIPAQWQAFVLPAWKFQQEHSDLFDVNLVAQNRERLQELLSNENPFLAIAACRTLSEARILGNDFMAGAFAKSSGLRQAVFTHLLLKNGPKPLGEAAVEEIGKIVDAADNADTLRGIALGALTALRERDRHTSLLGFQLLEKLEKKQAVLGAKTEADKYVNSVLRIASLPLLRKNAAFMMTDPPATEAAK